MHIPDVVHLEATHLEANTRNKSFIY